MIDTVNYLEDRADRSPALQLSDGFPVHDVGTKC